MATKIGFHPFCYPALYGAKLHTIIVELSFDDKMLPLFILDIITRDRFLVVFTPKEFK
ncbi:hypothetical protein VIBRN418_05659 [Vibrio sp. N418]|nr:hypothetical protein VIBRN418_05659 [Vibrio sp. N418]